MSLTPEDLPRSPTGRVPQWVRDELAGPDQQPTQPGGSSTTTLTAMTAPSKVPSTAGASTAPSRPPAHDVLPGRTALPSPSPARVNLRVRPAFVVPVLVLIALVVAGAWLSQSPADQGSLWADLTQVGARIWNGSTPPVATNG